MSKESIKPIPIGHEKQRIARSFASNAEKESARLEEIKELLADENSGVTIEAIKDAAGNKVGVRVIDKDGNVLEYEDFKARQKLSKKDQEIAQKIDEYLIDSTEFGTAKPKVHTEQVHNNPMDHLPLPIKKPRQMPEELFKDYPETKDPFDE